MVWMRPKRLALALVDACLRAPPDPLSCRTWRRLLSSSKTPQSSPVLEVGYQRASSSPVLPELAKPCWPRRLQEKQAFPSSSHLGTSSLLPWLPDAPSHTKCNVDLSSTRSSLELVRSACESSLRLQGRSNPLSSSLMSWTLSGVRGAQRISTI